MISYLRLAQLPQGEGHMRSALALAEEMARDWQLAPGDQKQLETLRTAVKAAANQ